MALEITSQNFDATVLKSNKPVLIDFWAEWCGPCRMVAPIIENISVEYADKLVVGKLNVDNEPGIAQQYGIRNIPTMLIFKDGQVVDKLVGALPKPMLVSKLQPYIS
jgi:thioredoxin 1